MIDAPTFGFIVVLAAVAAGAAAFAWSRRGGTTEALRAQLRRRVRGDAGTAERLIAYERERRPDAGEAELVRSAIERLERDNR